MTSFCALQCVTGSMMMNRLVIPLLTIFWSKIVEQLDAETPPIFQMSIKLRYITKRPSIQRLSIKLFIG